MLISAEFESAFASLKHGDSAQREMNLPVGLCMPLKTLLQQNTFWSLSGNQSLLHSIIYCLFFFKWCLGKGEKWLPKQKYLLLDCIVCDECIQQLHRSTSELVSSTTQIAGEPFLSGWSPVNCYYKILLTDVILRHSFKELGCQHFIWFI